MFEYLWSVVCGQSDLQSWRRLDSGFFFSNLLIILLNSISRASFRKSSFGFTRNGYRTPSLPRTVIFLGFCIEFMISTSSSNAAMLTQTIREEELWRVGWSNGKGLCFFPFWPVADGRLTVRFDWSGTTNGHGRTECVGNPRPLLRLTVVCLPVISKLQSFKRASAKRTVWYPILFISSRDRRSEGFD